MHITVGYKIVILIFFTQERNLASNIEGRTQVEDEREIGAEQDICT